MQRLAPPLPTIDELEIEWIVSDYALDDPSRRLTLPKMSVTEAFFVDLASSANLAIAPREVDRPSQAKEMLRLHPRLLASGDDSDAG